VKSGGGAPAIPFLDRLLLGLVRGRGAEFVVGDVLERYGADLAAGMTAWKARGRLRRQVLGTVVTWWRPGVLKDRRMGASHGDGGWGMGGLTRDLSVVFRSMARRPGLALGVVGTLGLGIGATTSIYSVVDGILLSPLQYEGSEQLVAVGTTFPGREWEGGEGGLMHLAGSAMLNYVEFEARARSFSALAPIELSSMLMPDDGSGPQLVNTAYVGADFFSILGVGPALGRVFAPDEFSVTVAETPVLLSYGAWQRRYGGDPGVVGRPLARVGGAATIVGILPADFTPPEAMFGRVPEFWLPIQPDHPRYEDRGGRSLYIVGRLAEGSTVASARTEMMGIADALAVEFPDGNVYEDGSHFGAGVNGLREQTVGTSAKVLVIFLGASALLLLIAILNAATLLLARGIDRTQEVGVRVALGAGRARILQLMLTESMVLSLVGGVMGALLAFGGVEAFHRYGPSSIPRMAEVAVDGRVLAVTMLIAMVAGLVAGLLPAVRASGREPWSRLGGSGARGVAEGGSRLRTALVSGQLAVAVLLLSGAGLLLHSFVRIKSVEPGFQPAGLITFRAITKRPGALDGEEPWQAWDLVLDEVRSVPGLQAVAGTSNPPFQSPFWAPRVLVPGDPDDTRREGITGYSVTPGYIATVGTRILRGRDIAAGDVPGAPRVALVNEAFISEHLGGAAALGVQLRMTGGGEGEPQLVPVEIVGVVENVVQTRAEEGAVPAVYLPYTNADWAFIQVAVRTDRPPEQVIPELRRAVARFNPVAPLLDVRTMEDRMAATRTDPRFLAMLIAAFSVVALLLAAAGLYASLAHAVGRRSRELGIRMALGAERAGVLGMVFLQGMRVAAAGLVLGMLGALALNRVLQSFVFEVVPADPLTLAGVTLLLVVVAAGASYLPARRATRVDPVEVLKSE